jgi:hypothetical protein
MAVERTFLDNYIDVLLALAHQLRPHTIESILAPSDVALALDVLGEKIRLPGGSKEAADGEGAGLA